MRTANDNYGVHDLSNGVVLSTKAAVGQINETKFFAREGEPAYPVDAGPLVKIKKK